MFNSLTAWCKTYLDFSGCLETALSGAAFGLIFCMLAFTSPEVAFTNSLAACAAVQAALMIQLVLNGVAKTNFSPLHKTWTIVSGGLIALHMGLCAFLAGIAIQMTVAPGLLYFALCAGTYVLTPLLFAPFFLAHQHFIVNAVAGTAAE